MCVIIPVMCPHGGGMGAVSGAVYSGGEEYFVTDNV